MSEISNSLREFQAALSSPFPPPETDHNTAARDHVSQLGENPTPTQLTTLMVAMLTENKHESRLSHELITNHLSVTMSTVAKNESETSWG